ncbi:MAG: protoporphyrinogen/coproporphyrinogen oxidase, partial [Vicinamibacteria bacterium]
MRRSSLQVVVIGGGITGLAAANRLLELAREQGAPPPSIRLLESTSRIGGAVLTERVDEYLLEGGADTLVARKPGGIELCEKLGLADRLFSVETRRPGTQVVRGGRLASLPRGFLMMAPMRLWPALASPLFSPVGKARMMCEFLIRPRRDPEGDESLSSFVTRRFGREVLERAAEPI